jgi:sugar/nucleoside kinase (ribokinase family)
MRGAEVQDGPVDLVVIGHVGVSIVHSGIASWTSAGGSGYAVAASAAALIGRRVGLVAQVGTGFDLAPLRRRQVDLTGVAELPGPSAKLRIREFDDGTRSFSAELGVAETIRPETFPAHYADASYIHLGTAPPDQQLAWLDYLRGRGHARISADMFEHYVAANPCASREVCDNVDLIFMNQASTTDCTATLSCPSPRLRSSSNADPPGHGSWWTVIRKRWRPTRRKWSIRPAAARSWPACSSRCGPTGSPSARP